MIDDKPIVLLYTAAFVKHHDQQFIDFTRAQFKKDFGGREPYLAPQDSWLAKGANVCAWGGALGLKNPGIGELGPVTTTRPYRAQAADCKAGRRKIL